VLENVIVTSALDYWSEEVWRPVSIALPGMAKSYCRRAYGMLNAIDIFRNIIFMSAFPFLPVS
jgi:hypothetical protein